MKTCLTCGKALPINEFGPLRRKHRKSQTQPHCRPCATRRGRERRASGTPAGTEFVPVAPFREWMRRQIPGRYATIRHFSEQCDIPERRVNEILSGRAKRSSVTLVDRVLVNDAAIMLRDLYPALYADEEEAA